MNEKEENCPICGKRKLKPNSKTCGNSECKGKYAEKTKRRIERQKEAESYIKNCAESSRIHWGNKRICVVCGETLVSCLTTHHFDRRENPEDTAILCWNCHQVFSSRDSGLRELQKRHEKYYEYNLKNSST